MGESVEIKKPKVSVIMPVYNTEQFLQESISSILEQTLNDLQIIILNDGSTDNSLSIIEKLAQKDSRIEYYSHANRGPSFTRNRGLEKVRGEYVYFMDSDDILEENALELCYASCEEKNLDFLFFDAIVFGDKEKLAIEYNRNGDVSPSEIYAGTQILDLLLIRGKYTVPVWLYFIRVSFLKNNQLLFDQDFRIYEDQIFSAKLYSLAERVSYLPNTFFHRRVRANSLMTSRFSLSNMKDYFRVSSKLILFSCEKGGVVQKLIQKIVHEMMDAATYLSYRLPLNDRLFIAKELLKNDYKVSTKSWLLLLFPFVMKVKAMFKKKN